MNSQNSQLLLYIFYNFNVIIFFLLLLLHRQSEGSRIIKSCALIRAVLFLAKYLFDLTFQLLKNLSQQATNSKCKQIYFDPKLVINMNFLSTYHIIFLPIGYLSGKKTVKNAAIGY